MISYFCTAATEELPLSIRSTIPSLLTAIVALASCFGASAQDSSRQQPTSINLPIPSQYDSTKALAALRSRLDAVFAGPAHRSAQFSGYVVSLKRGNVLYERNPNLMLTPASTTKLFSTAAAFHLFGPNGGINTDIHTDGRLDDKGTLHGNVYLIGRGDALLTVNDLEDLADKVRAAGVKRITGNVYADNSHFDPVGDRAVYSGDGEQVQPMPPVAALTVNKGTVTVLVTGSVGGRVSVQTIPSSETFDVVIAGGAPAKGRRARRGRLQVNSRTLDNGFQQFVVSGSPGANRTVSKYVSMSRPALAAAGTLYSRLRAGGIDIDGTVSEKHAPPAARRLVSFQRPLVDFASVVNKRSDNYLAEHVFKMVGAHCGDHTTTAVRAKKAMLEILDSLDIQRTGCLFNDGSGLSRRNRVSASIETNLLREIATQPYADEFRATLAIAGRDGTLRGRMTGTRAEANLVGKTGTLRNVSALSGYVTTADGEPLAFSFISNGPSVGTYKARENDAGAILAAFSYRTPVVVPPPAAAVVPPAPERRSAIAPKKSVRRKTATPQRQQPRHRIRQRGAGRTTGAIRRSTQKQGRQKATTKRARKRTR